MPALLSLHMGCLSAAAAREERSLEECMQPCCKGFLHHVCSRPCQIRVC